MLWLHVAHVFGTIGMIVQLWKLQRQGDEPAKHARELKTPACKTKTRHASRHERRQLNHHLRRLRDRGRRCKAFCISSNAANQWCSWPSPRVAECGRMITRSIDQHLIARFNAPSQLSSRRPLLPEACWWTRQRRSKAVLCYFLDLFATRALQERSTMVSRARAEESTNTRWHHQKSKKVWNYMDKLTSIKSQVVIFRFRFQIQISDSDSRFDSDSRLRFRLTNQIFRFQIQISDFRYQISDSDSRFRFQIQISDSDFRFRFKIQILVSDCRFRFKIQISDSDCRFRFQIQIQD